jgi:PleD family two-component response regulator
MLIRYSLVILLFLKDAFLGVARINACHANLDALLDAANQVLYTAKKGGRNRVEVIT